MKNIGFQTHEQEGFQVNKYQQDNGHLDNGFMENIGFKTHEQGGFPIRVEAHEHNGYLGHVIIEKNAGKS